MVIDKWKSERLKLLSIAGQTKIIEAIVTMVTISLINYTKMASIIAKAITGPLYTSSIQLNLCITVAIASPF